MYARHLVDKNNVCGEEGMLIPHVNQHSSITIRLVHISDFKMTAGKLRLI